MNLHSQSLYTLLPRLYQIRDSQGDEALRQFLDVFAGQVAVLEENLEQLYDDQFIETCAEWVVPYIGDLIGYTPLHNKPTRYLSARAEVANTIAYRRRKGTATMLEQLARDVTGWPARVVEHFQRLATSQFMNHIRADNLATVDLRDGQSLHRLNSAFENHAHTIDVRRIESDQGRYNIPNIGIFLWRLQAYPLHHSPARALDSRRFFFSPLGHNQPLFNRPVVETDITHLAEPINVPEPISRIVMHDKLEDYYPHSVGITIDGVETPIEEIMICNLHDLPGGDWAHAPAENIAIDPERGRIYLPPSMGADPDVRVSYHYGFSADMGGGEYERADHFDPEADNINPVSEADGIQLALDNLGGQGVVEIIDNGRYEESPSIEVNPGQRIEIRAANEQRPLLVLDDDMVIGGGEESTVTLNGLVIAAGRIVVPASISGSLRLRLRHCTLVPGRSLTIEGQPEQPGAESLVIESPQVIVEIEDCIVGPLRVIEGAEVYIKNSIVDATQRRAIAYSGLDPDSAGASLEIINSTVIGKLHAKEITRATNCLFHARLRNADNWSAPVQVVRKQAGCMRFCYLPPGSRTPRRYRCQPELAVSEAIRLEELKHGTLSSARKANIAALTQGRVRPTFRDLRYAQPAYAQLALSCAEEITRGADDESEMGAFHDLYQAQRETNLKLRLDEYLRFGLQAGIFYSN